MSLHRSRKTLLPVRAAVVAALLALVGCQDGTGPAARAEKILAIGVSGFARPGETPPIKFQVVDGRDRLLSGVEVQFSVVRGNGVLSTPTAVTDSMGSVYASFKMGPEINGTVVRASATRGTEPVDYTVQYPAANGRLAPDSLVLTPGCGARVTMLIQRPDPLSAVSLWTHFEVADSSVARVVDNPLSPGSWREVNRGVMGKQVGETTLTGQWLGGNLVDTIRVRVVPSVAATISLSSYVDSLGIGGRSSGTSRVLDQCGRQLQSQPVVYRSLDPEVVSVTKVDAPQSAANLLFRALGPGSGRVVAELGEVRDTLRIEVLNVRLLPADTTVAVGTTVQYRAIREDASGSRVPVSLTHLSVDGPTSSIVSADDATFTVKALAPGAAELTGIVPGLALGTRVTVVAPPEN